MSSVRTGLGLSGRLDPQKLMGLGWLRVVRAQAEEKYAGDALPPRGLDRMFGRGGVGFFFSLFFSFILMRLKEKTQTDF